MEVITSHARAWRIALAGFGLCFIAVALVHPVNRGVLRLVAIFGWTMIWISLVIKCRRRSTPSVLLLALPIIAAIYIVIPGQSIEHQSLQQHYIHSLKSLDGTIYTWGGESGRGIDCSGLPRLAMRRAYWKEFKATGNPRLLRAWMESWWFDASASALADGYRNYTYSIEVSGVAKDLDTETLHPGDLAITETGIHVLVYLGNKQWIQADPMLKQVVITDPAVDHNTWLSHKVTIHRWRSLSD